MSRKRNIAIAAGVLVVAGGAAAIAAVGHREGRMGFRDRMHGDEMAQMHERGMGMGMGEGRWGGRGGRGGDEADGGHDRDMRRGWMSRSVTAEEFDTRTRERFARFDKNSDGVIDASEIEAAIGTAEEGRRPFRDAMRQRFQGRFDTDRDGKIARAEVLERVRRDFARMDLTGDGRITDDDLPPAMRGRGVLKGEAGMMGRMGRHGGIDTMGGFGRLLGADANKDAVITMDEALAEAGRQFDLSDRNKDGAIDTADRDAMRKETTDYRVRRFLHAHGAKDGRITREQFFATAKERFAERDVNNDGRVDRQDRGMGPDGQGRGGRGMGPGGMGPGGMGPGGMGPGGAGGPPR